MILLIGEQPSAGGDPAAPLEGAIGKRLAEYAGLTLDEYLTRTERRNLIEYTSATWPTSQASLNAGMLWSSLIGRRTIMLGQRVAKSFGIQWQPLRWVTVDDRGTQVAILPHPSGKNLWWNEAENRAAARRFLTETFR
jgi:uracil-DNA glycosylase